MEINIFLLLSIILFVILLIIILIGYFNKNKDIDFRSEKEIIKDQKKELLKKTNEIAVLKKEIDRKAKIPADDVFRELNPYYPIKVKSWLDFNEVKKFIIAKFFPSKSVLINMELLNGMHKQFVIKEKDGGFSYKGNTYILDNELKYFILEAKMWAYDFHEQFALPLKRSIPLLKIKKFLENSGISEVEYASNPSTLERFVTSRIAEGIMKGQMLDDWMKQIRLMLIIVLLSVIIHLLLFMQKTGMLKQLAGKLPF